jgi:ABC-type branched-subunit amino acid transport system substrate-binding protein
VGIAAGVGGFFAGGAGTRGPAQTLTQTVTGPTSTVTVTGPGGTPSTVTQTVTSTVTQPGGTFQFKGEVVIGGSTSTTGPTATSVSKQLDMYNTWAEMINERGGLYVRDLGGRVRVKMASYADNGPPDPAQVERNYTRMIQEDNASVVIGAFTAEPSFTASAVAERLETSYIDNQAAETNIFKRPNNWVVGSLDTMTVWTENYLDLVAAQTNAETVATVHTPDSFGREVAGVGITPLGARQYAAKLGFTVLSDNEVPFEFTTDYTPVIEKLRSEDPDVVIFSDPTAVIQGLFWNQCKELGYKPRAFHPLMAGLKAFQDTTGTETGTGPSGDVYWDDSLPFEGQWGKKFFHDLEQRAGFTDLEWPWVTLGYLCLEIAAAAIEVAGSTERAKINEALHTMEVMTIPGPWRALDPADADVRGRWMGTIRAFPIQMIQGQRRVIGPPAIKTHDYIYPEPFTF